MKIDYDKEGMTIKLDKIPRLLYISEDGKGCGQVYENGVRIKELCKVNIQASTDDGRLHFIKYLIKYFDKATHSYKILGGFDPFEMKNISIPIKITDMDMFYNLLDTLKLVTSSDKVPDAIKEKIISEINNILECE